ncbi:hypothetical protein ABIE69_002667 [Rhodobacteraceae bacterium MBR-64]
MNRISEAAAHVPVLAEGWGAARPVDGVRGATFQGVFLPR